MMKKRLAGALLSVILAGFPASAEENGTLTLEIDPPAPRAGQQVGFYLRYEDPDPLTFIHERMIEFGDGGSAYFGAFFARCTGGGAAVNDALYNAVPPAVRSALGLYHFTYTYEQSGTYQVRGMVGTGREICPLVEERGRAQTEFELTVLP